MKKTLIAIAAVATVGLIMKVSLKTPRMGNTPVVVTPEADGFIHLPFAVGDFQDALILTPDEYAAMTPEQIDTEEQARYSKWVVFVQQSSQAVVDTPAPEDIPTPIDLPETQ